MNKSPSNKPNNIVRLSTTLDNLFYQWLEFLAPFHHLSNREMQVAVSLLRERYYLSKKIIGDPNLLNKVLMGEDIGKKIREEHGLSLQHFYVVKSKLTNKKFLIDNHINPRLIPNVIEGQSEFKLLFLFDIEWDQKKQPEEQEQIQDFQESQF